MKIHSALRRGSDHPNNCEDYLSMGETSSFFYACIFDGCSTGHDSYFASALFGKAFKDIFSNMLPQLDSSESDLELKAKFVTYNIARKVNEVRHALNLYIMDLLSTMIVCCIDKTSKECIICAFGDGFFSVDGVHTIIQNTRFKDKDNADDSPDYMAYDLGLIQSYPEFEKWFSQKSEIHKFSSVSDVTISSDGIKTFKKFDHNKESIDPIDFLVVNEDFLQKTTNMLVRKHNILHTKYGMSNTDDLSIIRIKFE